MTNGDLLRNATDEEMTEVFAEFLASFAGYFTGKEERPSNRAKGRILAWLESEVDYVSTIPDES